VGHAYTLVTPEDARMVHRIEDILQEKLERRQVDGMRYDTPAAHLPSAEEIRRYVEANRRQPGATPAASGRREGATPERKPRLERIPA